MADRVIGVALEFYWTSLSTLYQQAAPSWAFGARRLMHHPHIGRILLFGTQKILEEPFLCLSQAARTSQSPRRNAKELDEISPLHPISIITCDTSSSLWALRLPGDS
jgi:hypothetical protein